MPKGDSLLVPFNSRMVYGQAQKIESTEIGDILSLIKTNFDQLNSKIQNNN